MSPLRMAMYSWLDALMIVGLYLTRFWQPDGYGMNKVERMGGAYHPYSPDTLAGYEMMLFPSCSDAVARAQEALRHLDACGTLVDTELLARLLLRAEAVSSSRIEGVEMPASGLLKYEELDRLGVEHRLDGTEAQVFGHLHALTKAHKKEARHKGATSLVPNPQDC